MAIHARESFVTVRSEGAILPIDLLQRIVQLDGSLGGLRPEDYHREGERLNEVISRAWNHLLLVWPRFCAAVDQDNATSLL